MMKNHSGGLPVHTIFFYGSFTTDYFNYINSVDLVDYDDAVSDRYFKKSFDYHKL
jgi:hypothetical protein